MTSAPLSHTSCGRACHPGQLVTADEAGGPCSRPTRSRPASSTGRTLDWWRAAVLVQVAARRFRRLETGDWGRTPALVDAAVELLSADRPPVASRVPDLLDREHMAGVLGRALSPGQSAGGGLLVEEAQELATASGRRAVVRYRVRGLDGPGATVVVGKAFVEPRRAELLHGTSASSQPPPAAPPAGSVAAARARAPRPRAGAGSGRVPPRRHPPQPDHRAGRPDGGRARGSALAGRPALPAVSLPRHLSLDGETTSTREWAALVGRVARPCRGRPPPGRGVGVRGAIRRGPVVPLHKDFHPGHVLVGADPTDLHVIDLDEARQGDPAFDLAHFRSYVQLLGGEQAPGGLADAFLEEYAAATGWADHGSLAPFEAYAWLKIARQWTAAAAPFRAGSARRRTGVEHALMRGTACLSG